MSTFSVFFFFHFSSFLFCILDTETIKWDKTVLDISPWTVAQRPFKSTCTTNTLYTWTRQDIWAVFYTTTFKVTLLPTLSTRSQSYVTHEDFKSPPAPPNIITQMSSYLYLLTLLWVCLALFVFSYEGCWLGCCCAPRHSDTHTGHPRIDRRRTISFFLATGPISHVTTFPGLLPTTKGGQFLFGS